MRGIIFFFVILVSISAQQGCTLNTTAVPGNNRDKTTYFSLDLAFQPERREGGSEATELIVGDFTDDDYDDLVVLTQSAGMIFYKNILGTGFQDGVLIGVTPANFNYGSVASGGIVVAESLTGSLRYLENQRILNTFTLSSTFIQNRSIEATQVLVSGSEIALMTTPTNVIARLGPSSFTDALALGDVFPGAPARVQAGNLNNDERPDFMFVAVAGSQTPRFYQGTNAGMEVAGGTVSRAGVSDVNDFLLTNLVATLAPDALLLTTSGLEVLENKSTESFIFETADVTGDLTTVGRQAVSGDFLLADGRNDLYIIRSSGKGVLLKNSSATALDLEDVTASDGFLSSAQGSGPIDVVSGDFDGDNRLDIAELYSNTTIRIYMNTAKGE